MTRPRRVVALAAALALAGTLAFPSVAAPLFSGPTDDLANDVELAPSSDYAFLEGSELVVDLSAANPDAEGVNGDAVTTIADVFRVRYNGSRYAHVWLTHDSDAVTFYADGALVQSAAANVTLAPNESVAVGLRVDTTGATADGVLDEITVHSRAADPADVAATDADTEDADAGDGSTVQTLAPDATSRRFTALGTNAGESTAFDASELGLDGAAGALVLREVEVASTGGSVSVGVEATGTTASHSRVESLGAAPLGGVRVTDRLGSAGRATLRFSAPADYFAERNATLADLSVYRDDGGTLSKLAVSRVGERDGRLFFEAETPGFSTFVVALDRARVRVTDAALARATATPGESVDVTATVSNAGNVAGERTVPVSVGGTVVAERSVDVAPGDAATVTAQVSRDAPGEYAVEVGGVDAGTLAVAAENQSDDAAVEQAPADAPAPDDGPVREPAGFGLRELLGLVALLGVVAAALALGRRTPWG